MCEKFIIYQDKTYFSFSYRGVGLSVAQIAALFDEKVLPPGGRHVEMIPDPVEPVTDEDSEEEEDTEGAGMDVNHLGKGMLRQMGEIVFHNCDDNEPDIQVMNSAGEVLEEIMDETQQDNEPGEGEDEQMEDEPVAGPSKRRRTAAADVLPVQCVQLGRKKNKERHWSPNPPEYFGDDVPAFELVPPSKTVNDDVVLPYDFFRLFISDEFLDMLSTKSKLYCTRRGAVDKASLLNKDNLLTSMAIMYMSGYVTPAQKKLWWENRPDTQHLYVKKAMSRDTFRAVTSFTYFVEPEDQDLTDPFWKVWPLFDVINQSAKQLVQQSEYVSVDESMIRYFGPHPLKQAIREKPER